MYPNEGELLYIRDTIAAISTSLAEGAIGIVRISGEDAVAIAARIFQGASLPSFDKLASFSLAHGFVLDPSTGERVDEALFTLMRKPRSYTREDVVEINCHGGVQALRRTLEIVLKQGARLAEPGEFTKRAFLNGRIDLAQAEAVIDVIRAPSSAGLKLALSQLEGRFSARTRAIRKTVLEVRADLEAALDFQEEDVELVGKEQHEALLGAAISEVEEILRQAEEGKVYRLGVETVITGKPNVGKSSILNALLREERAIVTSMPGTTRDIIEETVSVGGIPLKLRDTAGIRIPQNQAEEIGVGLSHRAIEDADLVLCVLDQSVPLSDEDRKLVELVKGKKTVVILNKKDLAGRVSEEEVLRLVDGLPVVRTSALKGEGLRELEEAIKEKVFEGKGPAGEDLISCNARHQQALEAALAYLKEANQGLREKLGEEIVCATLAESLEALERIPGESATEDLLDRIFSKFCIGK